MTRKTRRRLFYSLLLLFIVLGGGAILYADGWRLDLTTFKARKVGGIYVRSFPSSSEIYLNGRPVQNKGGLIDHGTLISNLFPRNYKLDLKADGYQNWRESVEVNPSLVSQLKYAVLVPEKTERAATGTVSDLWIINQELLIKRTGGGLLWHNRKLPGSSIVGWTSDYQDVLSKDQQTNSYFLTDLSGNSTSTVNLNALLGGYGFNLPDSFSIVLDPSGAKNFIVQTQSSVLVFDYSADLLSSVKSSSTITGFAASPSWFAWTTFNPQKNRSRIFLYNRSSGIETNGDTVADKTIKLSFPNDDELGVLQDDGGFYIRKTGEGSNKKIASAVSDFVFSPSADLVATLESNSIEIFSFNSDDYWRFHLPDNSLINNLQWYGDENHLFAVYPDQTRFLDLNDKSLENLAVAAPSGKVKYDSQSNSLYFVKDSHLWKLDFP